MGGLSRPPGRLPACPNQEESSQVHGLLSRPSTLLLQGSPFWPQCSSNDLHKNFKASTQPPSPGGYSRASLPRRLDHLGTKQNRSANQLTQDYLISRKPRLLNQLQKIAAETDDRHLLDRSPLVSSRWTLGCSPILQRQDLHRSKSAPPFQSSVQKMLGIFYRKTNLPLPDPQALTTQHFSSFSPPIPCSSQAQRQEGSPPKVPDGESQNLDFPGCSPGTYPLPTTLPKIALRTDASLSGWGAHSDKGHYCKGLWSKEEIALHINSLEVLAVIRTMETLDLSNLHISLHTDNEVARFVINNLRSKAPALFPLLSMLCLLLKGRNLSITASRIPSSLNLIANALSRDHPLASDGMVTPSGGLRQNNTLEGSGRSGPNGNDSQQESRNICFPSPSSGSGSHRRDNSRLE